MGCGRKLLYTYNIIELAYILVVKEKWHHSKIRCLNVKSQYYYLVIQRLSCTKCT